MIRELEFHNESESTASESGMETLSIQISAQKLGMCFYVGSFYL